MKAIVLLSFLVAISAATSPVFSADAILPIDAKNIKIKSAYQVRLQTNEVAERLRVRDEDGVPNYENRYQFKNVVRLVISYQSKNELTSQLSDEDRMMNVSPDVHTKNVDFPISKFNETELELIKSSVGKVFVLTKPRIIDQNYQDHDNSHCHITLPSGDTEYQFDCKNKTKNKQKKVLLISVNKR